MYIEINNHCEHLNKLSMENLNKKSGKDSYMWKLWRHTSVPYDVFDADGTEINFYLCLAINCNLFWPNIVTIYRKNSSCIVIKFENRKWINK